MANGQNIIVSPQNSILGHCDLTATTACTTRAPTATASLAAANIVIALAANALVDQIINRIAIKGASSGITAASAANIVGIWHWDATKAWLVREILVTAVTPSASAVASFEGELTFDNFNLPATHALYMSLGVTTTASTTALIASIYGTSL